MRDKIMVIGGHGEVGSVIVRALRDEHLVLAGRSKLKMNAFLEHEKINAEIRVLDIETFDISRLDDVRLLIVCVDQKTTRLINYCIEQEIDYLDVTANTDFIQTAKAIPHVGKSRILLGVGLAPGLTNVLAESLLHSHPQNAAINIHIILGLGDHHGDAAIHWTLDNMIHPYIISGQDPIRPLTHMSRVSGVNRKYKTYNFNFADQHILNTKYKGSTFKTFLGFDSPQITSLLSLLSKGRLLNVLKVTSIKQFVTQMMKRQLIGSDIFEVIVENDVHSLIAFGHKEGVVTGEIAARCAIKLLQIGPHFGHLDMSDILTLKDLSTMNNLTLIERDH